MPVASFLSKSRVSIFKDEPGFPGPPLLLGRYQISSKTVSILTGDLEAVLNNQQTLLSVTRLRQLDLLERTQVRN